MRSTRSVATAAVSACNSRATSCRVSAFDRKVDPVEFIEELLDKAEDGQFDLPNIHTDESVLHKVLDGKIGDLFVIADPRTLGEMRRHFHKAVEAKLVGDLAKDLTGQPVSAIEAALASA